MPENRPGPDDVTLGLLLFLAFIGPLSLTAVSVIIACIVAAVAWFFDRPNLTGFVALALSLLTVAVQPFIPGFFEFFRSAFAEYLDAFRQEQWTGLLVQWLRFAALPEAWLRLMPAGFALGAVWVFMREARKASLARKIWGDR